MRRMIRFVAWLMVLGLGAIPVRAQLTLDECQRLAKENYPLLKKYALIDQATDYSVKNVKQGYLPQITLVGQASYQSAVPTLPASLTKMLDVMGTTVEGLRKDQYRVALDVNQVIWDGGTMHSQKEQAEAEGKVQQAEVDVQMYALEERVNDLYFALLLIDEKMTLQQGLESMLQANLRKLQALQTNGLVMQPDVDKLHAEYLRACRQRKELEAMRTSYRQMLALFIGRSETDVTQLQRPEAVLPASMDNRRPELDLFAFKLQQTQAQRKQINSYAVPRFSLFAQGFYGSPGMDMFADMLHPKFSLNGIVGLRMSWSISSLYAHKQTHHQLDMVASQIANAQEVFEFNSRMQTMQEQTALERYRSMREEDEQIVQLMTSVRQAAEVKLEQGIIDVNQLLEEITKENQARTEQSEHEIELLKHLYQLRYTINQ